MKLHTAINADLTTFRTSASSIVLAASLFLCLFFARPLHAQTEEKQAPNPTRQCWDQLVARSEIDLEEAYKRALETQSAGQRSSFAERQTSWLRAQEARCGVGRRGHFDRWVEAVSCSAEAARCVRESSAERIGELKAVAQRDWSRFRLASGSGTTLCEKFHRNLRSLTSREAIDVCTVPIQPSWTSQFAEPAWTELPVLENLDLVYAATSNLPPYLVKAERAPPAFEAWRATYVAQLKSGEIKPRLRSAVVQLAPGVSETVISFEPDMNDCTRAVQVGYIGGPRLFVRNGSTVEPFGAGVSSRPLHLRLYAGKAVFFGFLPEAGSTWALEILRARTPTPRVPVRVCSYHFER
jgi:uncharacterized protein YecT (DUF1311 family)